MVGGVWLSGAALMEENMQHVHLFQDKNQLVDLKNVPNKKYLIFGLP